MSLTLILTRHAKSDWGDPGLSDRDRPLNARGRRDAPRMGAWIAAQGGAPQLALVSAARRTRETWAAMAAPLGGEAVRVEWREALYHAEPDGILQALSGVTDATAVMVVGHNPGIGEAAQAILRRAPDHPRFDDYPTCATLIAHLPIDGWSEIDWGIGRPMAFATPHDLPT
jgi:phosphohistidine phosphatase